MTSKGQDQAVKSGSSAAGREAKARVDAWLARGRLRPTRQRKMLASLLVGDGNHRHVTAESLHEAAQCSPEPVSLATVYNTLKAFTDAGLLTEIMVHGARSYFDTRVDDHPHYFWEDRDSLTDAPAEAVRFASLPDAPEGTEIAKVDVVIRLRRTKG
ncbi:Fur family transcriptional regulator Irr [Oceanicella sp. SM1341]|uniref:Fur family transcriptional regulator Irr n=1 Tax=Oceanicella sp. SM1341 TaxID=1548889 RepID=UPI000E506E02|nr:transcriptional repressor [Oceanicella sp. SM1341]